VTGRVCQNVRNQQSVRLHQAQHGFPSKVARQACMMGRIPDDDIATATRQTHGRMHLA
jgi:hypothetical protein